MRKAFSARAFLRPQNVRRIVDGRQSHVQTRTGCRRRRRSRSSTRRIWTLSAMCMANISTKSVITSCPISCRIGSASNTSRSVYWRIRTHVRGSGLMENGIEKPNVHVTLASKISAEDCARLKLGYLDPGKVNPDEWRDKETEGILYVPKAGEILYRMR